MNIFALDDDPQLAASYMCDKHVVKMILETHQLLEIALGLSNSKWKHHPAAKWAKLLYSNQCWLYIHGLSLCREYAARYNKIHSYESKYLSLSFNPLDLELEDLASYHTEFLQLVPDQFKNSDSVAAYRDYYQGPRIRKFAKWRLNNKPSWYI